MPSEPIAERVRPGCGSHRALGLTAVGVLFLSLVCAAPPPPASGGGQQVGENELKAVYLYNFLQFVQWPEPRPGATPNGALVIGIVGETPLRQPLEALQASLSAGGRRPIRIVSFGPWREGLDVSSCHLLFLGPSEQQNFGRILAGLGGLPVLTVADAGNFLGSGGMIALTESQGKLRWTINRRAADKVGLRFGAQMLRLALKVME